MATFEEIILANGHCTQEDIEQARSIQKEFGGDISTILLNLGVISDAIYIQTLAELYGFQRFARYQGKPQKIEIPHIPTQFFIEHDFYPFAKSEQTLFLVTHNPMNSYFIATLSSTIEEKIEIYLATEEELREVRELYEQDEEEEVFDFLEDEVDKLKELASEAPVIKLVNNIFSKAVNMHASDIHFESYKTGMRVRFRIDGVLSTIDTIPNKLKQAVTARLKLISKMNISENRLPQDGRINIKISSQTIDIRSSSVPTAFGESFVLRLLGSDEVDLALDSMGFHPDNLALLKSMLQKPNGIILTTGPTGSGKTSTLYAALNYIHNDHIKIITVEDPVEYQLDGISQIQVKPAIDYTFANALRSILRQDPDVIMIGEIRDLETAQIAIQSALTGHLVLSTLHTNSAIGAVSRLLDMGMEYYLLKSSIIGLMAQRLARRLCDACKKPIVLTDEQIKLHHIDTLKRYLHTDYHPCEAVGCERCGFTGYKGRLPIMELVPFNQTLIKELDKNRDFNDLHKLGYRTLRDDGILKFLEGKTSLDEIIRLT